MFRLEPVRRGRLTRPRTRAEQLRLELNQSKLPKPKRPPDAWKLAAANDPRYLDPVETLPPPELLGLVDQTAAELAPAAPTAPPPITESWGSVHASGPRKITAEVLARAVELHRQGRSWPSIAAELGCHRMAFYHAIRRAPR
jgi:hypothetical protein